MNKSAATDAIRQQLKEVAIEVKQLGGWSGFKNGEWLFELMEKTFRHYSQNAAKQSFPLEFPGRTRAEIAEMLIASAGNKAALAGAITGAAVSADELVGLFTAGEGVIGLPVNIAVAGFAFERLTTGASRTPFCCVLFKIVGMNAGRPICASALVGREP